jgi:hypothetical protein
MSTSGWAGLELDLAALISVTGIAARAERMM